MTRLRDGYSDAIRHSPSSLPDRKSPQFFKEDATRGEVPLRNPSHESINARAQLLAKVSGVGRTQTPIQNYGATPYSIHSIVGSRDSPWKAQRKDTFEQNEKLLHHIDANNAEVEKYLEREDEIMAVRERLGPGNSAPASSFNASASHAYGQGPGGTPTSSHTTQGGRGWGEASSPRSTYSIPQQGSPRGQSPAYNTGHMPPMRSTPVMSNPAPQPPPVGAPSSNGQWRGSPTSAEGRPQFPQTARLTSPNTTASPLPIFEPSQAQGGATVAHNGQQIIPNSCVSTPPTWGTNSPPYYGSQGNIGLGWVQEPKKPTTSSSLRNASGVTGPQYSKENLQPTPTDPPSVPQIWDSGQLPAIPRPAPQSGPPQWQENHAQPQSTQFSHQQHSQFSQYGQSGPSQPSSRLSDHQQPQGPPLPFHSLQFPPPPPSTVSPTPALDLRDTVQQHMPNFPSPPPEARYQPSPAPSQRTATPAPSPPQLSNTTLPDHVLLAHELAHQLQQQIQLSQQIGQALQQYQHVATSTRTPPPLPLHTPQDPHKEVNTDTGIRKESYSQVDASPPSRARRVSRKVEEETSSDEAFPERGRRIRRSNSYSGRHTRKLQRTLPMEYFPYKFSRSSSAAPLQSRGQRSRTAVEREREFQLQTKHTPKRRSSDPEVHTRRKERRTSEFGKRERRLSDIEAAPAAPRASQNMRAPKERVSTLFTSSSASRPLGPQVDVQRNHRETPQVYNDLSCSMAEQGNDNESIAHSIAGSAYSTMVHPARATPVSDTPAEQKFTFKPHTNRLGTAQPAPKYGRASTPVQEVAKDSSITFISSLIYITHNELRTRQSLEFEERDRREDLMRFHSTFCSQIMWMGEFRQIREQLIQVRDEHRTALSKMLETSKQMNANLGQGKTYYVDDQLSIPSVSIPSNFHYESAPIYIIPRSNGSPQDCISLDTSDIAGRRLTVDRERFIQDYRVMASGEYSTPIIEDAAPCTTYGIARTKQHDEFSASSLNGHSTLRIPSPAKGPSPTPSIPSQQGSSSPHPSTQYKLQARAPSPSPTPSLPVQAQPSPSQPQPHQMHVQVPTQTHPRPLQQPVNANYRSSPGNALSFAYSQPQHSQRELALGALYRSLACAPPPPPPLPEELMLDVDGTGFEIPGTSMNGQAHPHRRTSGRNVEERYSGGSQGSMGSRDSVKRVRLSLTPEQESLVTTFEAEELDRIKLSQSIKHMDSVAAQELRAALRDFEKIAKITA